MLGCTPLFFGDGPTLCSLHLGKGPRIAALSFFKQRQLHVYRTGDDASTPYPPEVSLAGGIRFRRDPGDAALRLPVHLLMRCVCAQRKKTTVFCPPEKQFSLA